MSTLQAESMDEESCTDMKEQQIGQECLQIPKAIPVCILVPVRGAEEDVVVGPGLHKLLRGSDFQQPVQLDHTPPAPGAGGQLPLLGFAGKHMSDPFGQAGVDLHTPSASQQNSPPLGSNMTTTELAVVCKLPEVRQLAGNESR